MKKLLALILALALSAFIFAGCGKQEEEAAAPEKTEAPAAEEKADSEYLEERGEIVIGYTDYQPMNYVGDDGKLVGFDTELAEAVCEKLGLTPKFVEINWDTKEVELDSKIIDCIWNGFTITEDRKENIEFTKAYIKNKQVVIIRKSDAEKFKSTADLASAKLVAEVSSAGEDAIADDTELAKAEYIPVNKQTDALLEVKSQTADAAVLDYTLADAMVGEGTDYSELCMIDGLDLSVEEYGVGFRKGSDMAEKVNGVFDELISDGTMDTIAEKYGLSAIIIK